MRSFRIYAFLTVNKLRRMRWAGNVARRVYKKIFTVLFGKTEGKRSLGRPRRRWDTNIKLDFKGNGWADVE
jgi:hypothetical protein